MLNPILYKSDESSLVTLNAPISTIPISVSVDIIPGVSIFPVASITLSPRRLEVETRDILFPSTKTFPTKGLLFFRHKLLRFE